MGEASLRRAREHVASDLRSLFLSFSTAISRKTSALRVSRLCEIVSGEGSANRPPSPVERRLRNIDRSIHRNIIQGHPANLELLEEFQGPWAISHLALSPARRPASTSTVLVARDHGVGLRFSTSRDPTPLRVLQHGAQPSSCLSRPMCVPSWRSSHSLGGADG